MFGHPVLRLCLSIYSAVLQSRCSPSVSCASLVVGAPVSPLCHSACASCAPVLRCAIAPPHACAFPLRVYTLPLLLFLCLRSAAILVLSFAALHCASTVLSTPRMHSTCALCACFACVLSVRAPSFFVSTVGARFSVSSFPCFQSSHGFSYNSYI